MELAYATWPGKRPNEIAEQIGCAQIYVGKIRDLIQVNTSVHLPEYITGKDGKPYSASRGPNKGSTENREQITELVRSGDSEIASTVGVSMATTAAGLHTIEHLYARA